LKIGFFGGSFDPVHFGHLMAAQDALEQGRLDRIFLVPAAQAPLKPAAAVAPAADRLAMLHAAIAGNPQLEVSDFELRQGGISYTIDTVRHFRTQFSHDELSWIIGADQLPALPQWKDIAELARLCAFIYLERPGHPALAAPSLPGLRLHRCAGHLVEISSSELRRRAQAGRSLRCFCPPKVVAIIEEKNLYR
jgi:nicotinate-nucleotide adenylyltransferase